MTTEEWVWAWVTRDLVDGELSLACDVWTMPPKMRRICQDTVLWLSSDPDNPMAQCLETVTLHEAEELEYVVPATWREVIKQPLWIDVEEEE